MYTKKHDAVKNAKTKRVASRIAPVSPFSYRPGVSVLHRVPALYKLIALLVLQTGAFFSVFGLLAAGIAVVLGCAAAKINFFTLFRGISALFLMIFFVIFVRTARFFPLSFDKDGLRGGLLFGAQLLVSFSAGALIFSVTTMNQFLESLEKIFRNGSIALALALMLGFLPRFFEVWEEAQTAWKARAGKNNPQKLVATVSLVTELMIIRAVDTADALTVRGGMEGNTNV